MIIIKALTETHGVIAWCFHKPSHCAKFWKELTEKGKHPKTGEILIDACYFTDGDNKPLKRWKRLLPLHGQTDDA